jgi:hypothetical protein
MKSNGFGSLIQEIVVKVSTAYVDRLNGYQVLAKNDDFTEFQIDLKTTRPDDDETVIYEIHYLLSALKIPRNAWSIDWDRSSY